MSLFAVALVAHVVVAVVGVGLVAAVPLAAIAARRGAQAPAATAPLLDLLLRTTRWSLAAMAATAVLLDVAAGGAFHGSGWFRASAAIFVFLGVANARARAAARHGGSLRRIEAWGWAMSAAVVLLTALMVLKPFA